MPKELSWREKLTAAKEAGFDFVEMGVDETDEKLARLDISQTERAELNSLTAELRCPFGPCVFQDTGNILWAARIPRRKPEASKSWKRL